jgi:hypothetical protein
MDAIKIHYIFGHESDAEQSYILYFDPKDMSLLEESFDGQSPEDMKWADLETNKCEHCPLSQEKYKNCPAAYALGRVAKKFANVKSYTETKVSVVTKERTYFKETSTQEALQSIFGLIMATCECPYTSFLRPMARFHLPFGSLNETMVRGLSFFLLKQYFKGSDSKMDSFDLTPLINSYENLQTVNMHLSQRIIGLGKGDADVNAIVILDGFASLLSMQIGGNFADLRPLFADVGLKV